MKSWFVDGGGRVRAQFVVLLCGSVTEPVSQSINQ